MRTHVLCVLLLGGSATAQYASDFETLNASAAGTIITGQDGYYVPVAGSLDCTVMTYAGNAFGIAANPNGGNNFFVGRSMPTNIFARAQRALTLPANGIVYIQYDILCNYAGTGTPANNIGSFSFQPSTNAIYVNLLATWPAGATFPPPTWNADVVAGSGTPPGTVTTVLPDPAFQGLAVNVWHTWGCTVDLNLGVHVDFRITNGVTGITTIFTPTTPILLPRTVVAPMPTDFRFFAGGSDNVFAIDNVRITGAVHTTFGAGCAGSAGVPTLDLAHGSWPLVGTTVHTQVSNLPLSLAFMLTGLSNTMTSGSVPLPHDLSGHGFPGCFLLVDPVAVQFLFGVGTQAISELQIPNTLALVGLGLYSQAMSIDLPRPAFTNGARMIVGS